MTSLGFSGMGFSGVVREEARLILLQALAHEPDGRLNSALLVHALEAFGLTKSRDYVHGELAVLESLGAVTLLDAGAVKIACLTARGQDHVERRLVLPGVKRSTLA